MKGLETFSNLRKFSIHNNNLTKYMIEISEFPQKSVEYCCKMNNKIFLYQNFRCYLCSFSKIIMRNYYNPF